MAALEDGPRAMGAVAGGEAAVYYIARRNLLELMEQMPQLAAGMAREAGRHNRDFNEQCTREALEGERLSLVGRFASSIAHDLKNPLNIIGISADMACMASATAESREVSRARIRQQVERISNMVSELLEFAQGSGADYIAARMDYGAFVRRLMDEIEPEFALKSVKVECVNEPPAALVRANPQRLARVFRNFIGNAADAMPEGGAVRLSFRVNSDPSVVTELHDTGRGIPPQMLDHLFEAFATCGKANGAGLGLSVCRKIIQDHQGTVYARNAPEGGAVFGFTLPICKT
jgi:signal transduction histidine kinase